ncbi:hypothetical protein JYU34_013741 [Plutella xylostella]|uniref:Uncharacterized protein n=1 Tax=Plutella xylostella TaxID=51655 RepID=A0ABQ7QAN9_PLUXY|nr:hypothetical protein JYU34_013741 [Plutella xylostella]
MAASTSEERRKNHQSKFTTLMTSSVSLDHHPWPSALRPSKADLPMHEQFIATSDITPSFSSSNVNNQPKSYKSSTSFISRNFIETSSMFFLLINILNLLTLPKLTSPHIRSPIFQHDIKISMYHIFISIIFVYSKYNFLKLSTSPNFIKSCRLFENVESVTSIHSCINKLLRVQKHKLISSTFHKHNQWPL